MTRTIKVLVFVITCVFLILAYLAYGTFHKTGSPKSATASSGSAGSVEHSKNPTASSIDKRLAHPDVRNGPTDEAVYFTSRDLNALVNTLKDDPSKKAELALVKAKAIEECVIFARRPNYALDIVKSRKVMGKGDPSLLDRYANDFTQRCISFANSGPMTIADSKNLYEEAAKDGSPEAIAHQLREQLSSAASRPTGDLRAKSIDIINSGDPAAIFELSSAFGTNSKFTGEAVGSEKATAAWQLVACDMGLDCSDGSALMIGFCLNGGIYCEAGDLRYNMEQSGFSPADFEEIIDLENKIYTHIITHKIGFLLH